MFNIIRTLTFTTLLSSAVADMGPGASAPVRPFRLDQVRLGDGMLQEKRDLIKEFLLAYDERRFLILFNNQAGRPNPAGLQVPGGWEDGGLLSGHWTGHYMTALSQAYADQGETKYKEKLDWMVHELAACQKAITARMADQGTNQIHLRKQQAPDRRETDSEKNANDTWIPTHPGYLGALPEDTVLRLGPPRWAVYGADPNTNTWAPWYTQHKIMRGLLDTYYNTNNSQALDVVKQMAGWAHLALTIGDKNQPGYKGNLTREDLNYMWDIHIAGEYGGANEVFAELYDLTGDETHLTSAKAFDNRASLFDASVNNKDILVVTPQENPGPRRADRLHANQHVPQFVGYMRIYEQHNERDYFEAAKNFWGWIVPHRGFAHGGTGGNFPGSNDNSELFQNRDNIANAIASPGAESCTTYNMIKLSRNLFFHEQDAKYMDYYERGLFNHVAGTRSTERSTVDPQLTYFQPLTPGTKREFGNTGTCCGGTGLESHTKHQETVYLRSADGKTLWINLFVPSTLHWDEKNFEIKQETSFPRKDTAKFTIRGSGPLNVKLRVPGWVQRGFSVSVNGKSVHESAHAGTYMSLDRTWKTGDIIEVKMPFSIRIERALDRPDTQSIMWGPVNAQIIGTPSTTSGYQELSLYKYLKLDGDYASSALKQSLSSSGDTTFDIAGTNLTARPYYVGDANAASSYFRRVEPVVLFGSVDSGVPNRKQNQTLPHYDVPVKGIQSPGSDGPTFLDIVWDKAPFKTPRDFESQVGRVAKAFHDAGIYNKQEKDAIVQAARDARKSLAV